MNSTIIISNRLPITVRKENKELVYEESIGGLSTGLKSYHQTAASVWVGWPGIPKDDLTEDEQEEISEVLMKDFMCHPVFLSKREIREFYLGFSNKTIWPIFHYFPTKAEYDEKNWKTYKEVNKKFYRVASPFIKDGSLVWVHDYQLMLLPSLIKGGHSETKVGFFLHIPFPSFEIFRLLKWRYELLEGLMGADLIGFHTHDYVRHFLNSTRRIIGTEDYFNTVLYDNHKIFVDAFPMGINFNYYENAKGDEEILKKLGQEEEKGRVKIVLSVDRLDYTKGIPERINAFREFLRENREYIERARLILIVAPSRDSIDSYEELLKQIRELVSEANGELGTIGWVPIWFFYQSFSAEELITLYRNSDVLLVTPLRDGMNLVAKEYLAARKGNTGMIVLSETAGAASQLVESVIVNANDRKAIADGIKQALEMSLEEQEQRVRSMRRRIKNYNVNFWADEFIQSLHRKTGDSISRIGEIRLDKHQDLVEVPYKKAHKRVMFLDYDGTLTGFSSRPEESKPDKEILDILKSLAENPKNTLVLSSGRDRGIMDEWFGRIPRLVKVASHGLFMKESDKGNWEKAEELSNDWKKLILPILELYTDYMPGAFIENKEYSLALHFRLCNPDMVSMKITDLRETIDVMIKNSTLELQEGKKVLEIKDYRVNKDKAVIDILNRSDYDFILGAGDDVTDEHIFSALPEGSFSIKVGPGDTKAAYRLKSYHSLRSLLKALQKYN